MTNFTDEEDMIGCEACGKSVPFEDAVMSEDCYFCPECFSLFRAEFRTCAHDWKPHISTMGEDGFICNRCSGFVANEDFASLGLAAPGETA